MPQTRLHVATDSAGADRLFPALEAAFEEDGLPIAVFDLDEAKGIKEVSLYVDDGVDVDRASLRAVMRCGIDAAIGARSCPTSTGSPSRSKGCSRSAPGGFWCMARTTATSARRRPRHRDRGRVGLRHRPSRHHRRLPGNDRDGRAPGASEKRARPRDGERRAGDRRSPSWRTFRCWRRTSIRSRRVSPPRMRG